MLWKKGKKNSLKMNCDVIYGFHEAKEQQIAVIWQVGRCRNYYIAISDKCVWHTMGEYESIHLFKKNKYGKHLWIRITKDSLFFV